MKNKKSVNDKFVLAFAGAFVLTWAGALGTTLSGISKKNARISLAKANGYDQANSTYIQVAVDRLDFQLEKNIITQDQYQKEIKAIQPLDHDVFMEGKAITQQAKDQYITLKNTEQNLLHSSAILAGCFLMCEVGGAAVLCADILSKKLKNDGTATVKETETN